MDHDQLIAYVRRAPDRANSVIVVASLDPHAAQAGTLSVHPEDLGLAADGTFTVHDLVTDARYNWSHRNHVFLDPIGGEPLHMLTGRARLT